MKETEDIKVYNKSISFFSYLSSGCSMQEIAFGHFLGLTTVSLIIKETTKVLWDTLQPLVLMSPTTQEWDNISDGFFSKWNMPNCVGAIDGKHVNVQAPYNAGSEFFNYKKAHSIVLMAACDAYYKFTLVDIGAAGGCHDSTVFSESDFGHSILNNTMNIPHSKLLPHTNIEFPYFFVADAAFPLHKHIMKPYPDNNLLEEKRVFNYRLSRARRTIENTFGILAQRWRILRNNIIADYNVCQNIVMACVVLHNFILENESTLEDTEKKYCPSTNVDSELPCHTLRPGTWRQDSKQLQSVKRVGSNNSSRNIIENRNKLTKYLNSPEGSVPWQLEYVLAGSVPPNFSMDC